MYPGHRSTLYLQQRGQHGRVCLAVVQDHGKQHAQVLAHGLGAVAESLQHRPHVVDAHRQDLARERLALRPPVLYYVLR